MRTLGPEQARRFLDAARFDPLEALYVAITAGLRQGEMLALQWRDVDTEARTVRITGYRISDAPARASHDGQDFYFCAERCRDRFVADPTRYMTESAVRPDE